MLGIGPLALEATKRLTGRSNAWIDVMTGDFARPRRECTCEACVAYHEIIDSYSQGPTPAEPT